MDDSKANLVNVLGDLYVKIDTETPQEQREMEFVDLLLKQIKICIGDSKEENMSLLQEMLGHYSKVMLQSAHANEIAALQTAKVSDISLTELDKMVNRPASQDTKTAEKPQAKSSITTTEEQARIDQIILDLKSMQQDTNSPA